MSHDECPACPVCHSPMRKYNHPRGARSARSHSFYAQPQLWICPQDEAEVSQDEHGHLKRAADARHPYTRVWEARELEAEASE